MRQLNLSLPRQDNYREEDFLVSECSRAAWQRLMQPAAESLLLAGPAHCGKTHLAHIWAQRHGAAWAEGAALLAGRAPEELFANAPALVVDDIAQAQEATLFHLLNHARAEGCALLLTRQLPAQWEQVRLPDLRSRLQALPQALLEEPDDITLAALVLKLFADRQTRVAESVITYLIPRMERSYDAARRLVERLDAEAIALQSAITLPLARQVLAREGQPEMAVSPHDEA